MPDPDYKITGGGGGGGSGRSPKNFFRHLGPYFRIKIRGGSGPPGPSPGSANE